MEIPIYNCVLCAANVEETTSHLFLECPFAQQCWNLLNLHIADPMSITTSLEALKAQLLVLFFMDVIILHGVSGWLEMI